MGGLARILRYATALAFATLILLVVVAKLMGTESALKWGADRVESLSDGVLVVQDLSGSLYGPLKIGVLTIEAEQQRIEIQDLRLDWTPLALLRNQLRVTTLSAQIVRVIELGASTEPVNLPDTLQLPVTLSLPDIRIDRLELKAAGNDVALTGIELALERTTDQYLLDLRRVTSDWGALRGDVVLGDTRPFHITASVNLQQGEHYSADAKATGTLSQLIVEVSAKALGGQATLAAEVAPLDKMPLVSAKIAVEHLDPQQLRGDLQKADLSAELAVKRDATHGFTGNVTLKNALPGRWDQARLPVDKVSAAISGNPETFELSAIQINLADGSRFEGSGRMAEEQLQLALTTKRFNPQGVYGTLRPMRLTGKIELKAQAASQQLVADLLDGGYRFKLDATRQGEKIELRDVAVEAGAGRLNAHGTLSLADPGRFALDGKLASFNPADLGDYPAARINAAFSGQGQLTPQLQASVKFSIADSQFRRAPLAGQGSLSLSADRFWDVAVKLNLARSHLSASGALGNAGDRLALDLEVDNLAVVDPALGGRGRAKGTLEGRFAAPSGQFDVQASNLSWATEDQNYRLADLQATAEMGKGFDGLLRLESSLRGLVTPQIRLDQASLNAQGTRAQHTLLLSARNPTLDLAGRVSGRWKDGVGWAGQIQELSNRGRHAFALKSPVALEIARQRLVLGSARFDLAGADLAVHDLSYDAGKIASSGAFSRLPLVYLKCFAADAEQINTDLTLTGSWQVAVAEQLNGQLSGHLSVRREAGDISYGDDPKIALGLDRLTLDIEAKNNLVNANAEASGTQLGTLQASAQSQLSLRDGRWGIAGEAPVQGSAELAIKSLAWLQPIIGNAVVVDGALKAQLRVDGRFAQPDMSGFVSGSGFTLALPEQGLNLKDGHFQATFKDQSLQLGELVFKGGDGELTGKGQLTLENALPVLKLSLAAKQLEVLSRSDRLLVLSGTSELSVTGKDVRVSAQLKADRGSFELPRIDTPTLSDDVVVLGRPTAVAGKRLPYNVDFDLALDLGDRFVVKGKGLDAQLGGTLKLIGENGALPSSRGTIRVLKGTYTAYGQRLAIERGYLNFQGPLDNPGLNILAMRKDQTVEAGVAVTGTAQTPLVKLVSTPTVPDGEKLSWLVLGHGIEDSSAQEFSVLQAAAGALLDRGDSVTLQQKVARAAGLDEVTLKGGGGLESTVLALGKRLSSRAYVSFEQGVTGASSLVKINYTLSKRVSVRVQAGTSPAIDLFYTFSFD